MLYEVSDFVFPMFFIASGYELKTKVKDFEEPAFAGRQA